MLRRRRDNRGGYRPGAGRKGEWKSGKTKAVKLPEKLLDEIVVIARAMDDGKEVRIVSNESVTESKRVEEVVRILNEALLLKPNAGGAIKAKVREALKLLQGEKELIDTPSDRL